MIGVLKRTLSQQICAGAILEELELQSFLHRAAAIVNLRPLSARSYSVEDFAAVTPRDLLLGAAPSLPREAEWQVGTEEDLEARLDPRTAVIERKVQDWWMAFSQDVFPLLVPYRKWANPAESVDLGAIVLVQYSSRYSKDRYRLGRVLGIEASRDGLTRTVKVGLRNLHKAAGEHPLQNKAGLTVISLPVQRLVVVLPGREQPPAVLEGLGARDAVDRQPVVPMPAGPLRVQVRAGAQEDIIDL